MVRFLVYLLMFLLVLAAGFVVYALVATPDAPRVPTQIDVPLTGTN